jgi:hypothetical protein
MPNDPSNAVVRLTMRHGEKDLAIGSGVLYQKNGKVYIVTAWHNVTGRHSINLKPLSPTGAFPDNVVAYIACRHYSDAHVGYLRRPFTIPLEVAGQALYLIHPQSWPRVDVVAIPIDPQREYISEYIDATGNPVISRLPMQQQSSGIGLSSDIECIQDFEQTIPGVDADLSEHLAVSDDLFILGYPKGITDMYGQPIWKRATVATSPHLGWERQRKFLVDCASREGMSGAPAVYYNKSGKLQVGGMTYVGTGSVTILHGIYTGRMGRVSEFEAQIGTVWQRILIDEIIEKGIPAPLAVHIVASPDEVRAAIQREWPATENYAAMILEPGFVKSIFTSHVMEKLAGRADPEYVSQEVLEIAKGKQSSPHS